MRALRFNPNLFLLLAIALLGALFLSPDSLHWLRAPTAVVFYPISASARGIARAVNARASTPQKSLGEERDAGKAREQLQNELETLKSQFAILQSENRELQARLEERKDWPQDLMKFCEAATVSGADVSGRQVLTLTPGSARDAVDGSAVLDGANIVGKLKTFGLGESKVVLITDPESTESAEIRHYRPDGSGIDALDIIYASRGDGPGRLVVKGVKKADIALGEKAQKVTRGDMVVLHDPDWPQLLQGRYLGEIESFEPGSTPLFCDIVIRPRRDLMKLRQVMVWKK